MNLFDFFVKLNHKAKKDSWIETVATFTGKRNRASTNTRFGPKELDYFEYEILYMVDGKRRNGWYSFYPLSEPEMEELQNMNIKIRYDSKKPFQFERIEDYE